MVRWLTLFFALSALAQDFHNLEVIRVATTYRYTDGPAPSRGGEFLLFADVPSNRILKFTPGKGAETYRENAGGASGLVFDEKGRLLVCESTARRVIRIDAKGAVEVLAETFVGKRLNAPNDITVRHDGHVWFTDPAFASQLDTKELPFFGIFHLSPRNELSTVWRGATRPNGIALSPNGRTLYATDSDLRLVRAWDLSSQGAASNERVVVSNLDGIPGGIKCDEKGNLYVAANGILIFSHAGQPLHRLEILEKPSNCAFGDADFQSLYVTARTSLYRIRMPVRGSAGFSLPQQ